MKRIMLVASVALTALLLSACGSPAAGASSNQIFDAVNTAVAMTVAAQPNLASATPAASPTPSPTSTLFSAPTVLAPATPTPLLNYSYSSSTSDCNDSSFVKDVTIPDGTVLAPGQEFVKTWKLANTGSCAWNADYSLVFSSGNEMSGGTTYLNQSVNIGKKAEISVDLTAPDAEGTYYGYWMLADDSGYTFGATVYVEIVVSESATDTPTATASPTATPTLTVAPTSTTMPTATPTPLEAPTGTPTGIPTATASLAPTPVNTASPAPTLSSTATPTASSTETH